MSQVKTRSDQSMGESLPQDDVFKMLSNPRRRHVVHYLAQQETDDRIPLRDLSRQVAAWENNIDPLEVTSAQRKRVYTALHQSHLPKLDDADVVDFDEDRSIVEPTDSLSNLQIYMEVVPHNEIPWSVYYTGLGLFCGSLVIAAGIGLFPFSELPALAWGAISSLLLTGSGLAHIYRSRRMKLGRGEAPPDVHSHDS